MAGDTVTVWYDGRTPTNWVSSNAYTGGVAIYGQCASSQAFKKGGLAGNNGSRTILSGSMSSSFAFATAGP